MKVGERLTLQKQQKKKNPERERKPKAKEVKETKI